MDRRRFIALMAGVLGTSIIDKNLAEAMSRVVRRNWLADEPEAGEVIMYALRNIPEQERDAFRDELAREMASLARKALQPGRRFEIRVKTSFDFGYLHGMAWYSGRAMQIDPDWTPVIHPSVDAPYLEGAGHYLISREIA